jgi:hypothetical protein
MVRKILVVVGAALAIAGCGSSSGSGSGSSHAASPLATELSYFPTNTPFVLTVATDPNAPALKSAEGALLSRFPEANLGIAALEQKLQSVGLNYDADIKPLFGNPIAFGAASPTVFSGGGASAGRDFLFAWVAKSASGLKSLISKLVRGGASSGTRDGASLYQLGSESLAVNGATALLGSIAEVTAALDRHAHGAGFTAAEYSSETNGLPQSTLMEVFGNLTGVLSQPGAAKAHQVPWVAAIRSYGAAVSTSASGVSFQYRVDTSGGPLTSSQIPIATGTTAPQLAGTAPIIVGINDPAQLVTFGLKAEQVASPSSYAKFESRNAKLRKKTGVDLQSLTSLFTGSLIIESDTHTTIGRVTVSDPAKATSALAALAGAPKGTFKKDTTITKLGGGFYSINEPKTTLTVGVAGNQLVLGQASVAQAKAFAAAPASAASFAHGSVAFQIALADLLRSKLGSAGGSTSLILQTVLSHIGNVTGWAAASASALTGSATLAIH